MSLSFLQMAIKWKVKGCHDRSNKAKGEDRVRLLNFVYIALFNKLYFYKAAVHETYDYKPNIKFVEGK